MLILIVIILFVCLFIYVLTYFSQRYWDPKCEKHVTSSQSIPNIMQQTGHDNI